MKLSSRVKGIPESVTLKLNSKALELQEQGKQIYNLTAGQLPFRPPLTFIDSLRSELDFLKSYQYSPVAGYLELRKKLLKHIEHSRGISFQNLDTEFDCVISNGAKHSISNILGALIDPGDEVVIFSPYWISYPEMIKFCRGVPIVVQTNIYDMFTPNLNELKKVLSSRTKAVIINSPNNPAGIHYSDEWMSAFADLMEEFPDIAIISDEIYFDVYYYDPKPTYFYQKKPELLKRTIIVDGISKAFASTGLRIGYCVAPIQIAKAMENLQGQLTSSASSLVQRAMLAYDFDNAQDFLTPVKNHLRDNAIVIREKLKEHNLMKCWYQPTSAFYFMIDFTQAPIFKKYDVGDKESRQAIGDYSVQICEDILNDTGVVIVPGTDFGLPNSARLSLVLHKEAFLEAMGKLMRYLVKGLES
jgi:aspartate aminotransferase